MSSEPLLFRHTVRLLRLSLILFALVAVLALVVLSPIGMQWVAGGQTDWSQLSNIGQAYGGISAILSTLAILGVAVSLILQNRQVRAEQLLTLRNRQLEIIKLSMEMPHLVLRDPQRDDATVILDSHSNLWMQQWHLMWDLNLIDDAELRSLTTDLFLDERRQAWWDRFGSGWDGGTRLSNKLTFSTVVDQGLAAARRRLAELRAADEPAD